MNSLAYFILSLSVVVIICYPTYAYSATPTEPFVFDSDLKAELVFEGLESPTNMAFLGPNDILVLEQHKQTVSRIVDGVKSEVPLQDLGVKSQSMLGIAIQNNISESQAGIKNDSTYVFLYLAATNDDGGEALVNGLYRFELVDNKLVNPKLLLDLPPGIATMHNGGVILIGPDKYLYVTIGELRSKNSESHEKSEALNYQGKDAIEPDGRGGILRIDQNGQPIGTHGILGDKEPLNKYYAYGIRNSFGMDFDPLTGKLWDTENGPEFGDEINRIKPGFNSGSRIVQGPWIELDDGKIGPRASEKPDNLVDFGGKGKYSPPEFTWKKTVGPTAIKFISTDKLGKQYENDILVADANNGKIYHFKLNENRTELLLEGPLTDKVADKHYELNKVVFAEGFGGTITDLDVGPDGYLYVVGYVAGKIFRIVPR